MKRIYSLKGRILFQEVIKKGKSYKGAGFRLVVLGYNKSETVMLISQNSSASPKVRIGISVNRKYGNAVARNRLKRMVRSICRDLLPKMRAGYYIIICPDTRNRGLEYNSSRQDIEALFKKAGIITG